MPGKVPPPARDSRFDKAKITAERETLKLNPPKPTKLMSRNALPEGNDKLFSLGEDMLDGLEQREAVIGVKQFTRAALEIVFGTAFTAQSVYDAAQAEEGTATTARNVGNSNAKGSSPRRRGFSIPTLAPRPRPSGSKSAIRAAPRRCRMRWATASRCWWGCAIF